MVTCAELVCALAFQVAGHEARTLVDERFHPIVGQNPGVVQHRVVRQRLDRGDTYKRCELQVVDAEFVPGSFEVGTEQAEMCRRSISTNWPNESTSRSPTGVRGPGVGERAACLWSVVSCEVRSGPA